MPRKTPRDSDMRGLDRKSMYTIFSPLDANERLPRELVKEGRRHRTVGRRELAGMMWIPAIVVLLTLFGWTRTNALIALIASIVVLGGLVVFAFRAKSS